MSHRLQILVPDVLDRRIRKAAQRSRQSAGAWVRQAIERALQEPQGADPLDQLSRLGAPTGDIGQLLAEIEAGRG
ncbi:MAG: hypothetical protein FJW23_07245 [Acidimicrobiia bacterium]|nr:hypothetical protein [Acidimicrobiia bacterium]